MINAITIMLVEDNPDHAFLVLEGLKKASDISNEVKVVTDGQQALDYLYRRGIYNDYKEYPMPDLILLDIKLPKLDGHEVLKAIKKDQNLKNIPVIMLTSSKRDEDVVESYHGGANSYIIKPVSFKEFTSRMKELQLYWCVTNTMPPKRKTSAQQSTLK